jgi:hypothetical protein
MQMTIRIDGNPDYEYAKTTLTLIDGVLYVVETNFGGRLSFHLLNDGYIAYAYIQYSDNLPKLLELIKANYYDIVIAMKFIAKNGGIVKDVGYIKGLTVSDW